MSFYRVGQSKRKKAPVRKRPGWDDTVNDLTVYRATPEEMMLRKESHKSKNHISVKLEKMRKERQKGALTGAQAQQLAIMKEVLYDQHQLQKVLAKSDTMMAVVKDLFGDDPKRFEGFPNVTAAPRADLGGSGLVASVPEIYTRTEQLSDSVMHPSALNDMESSDSDDGEEEVDRPGPISYEPKLNLQRFQEYIQEEEKRTATMDPPSLVSQLNRNQSNHNGDSADENSCLDETTDSRNQPGATSHSEQAHLTQLLSMMLNHGKHAEERVPDTRLLSTLLAHASAQGSANGFSTPPRNGQKARFLPSDRTPPSAMNDTKKVKKTKKMTRSPGKEVSGADSLNTSSMSDMRKVLQELESEMATYEHQTGRRRPDEPQRTDTLSGYTTTLVSTVSRLIRYLKETDLRVRTEMTLREQLTQDVVQLRTIIDALATDLIVTQEEYGKLYSEHQRYKDNTTAALASLNNQVRELRSKVTGASPRSESRNHPDQDPSFHSSEQQIRPRQQNFHDLPLNTSSNSKKSEGSRTSTPLIQNQQDTSTQSGSGSYQALPAHFRPTDSIAAAITTSSAGAVMLSPPVRKTRVQAGSSNLSSKNTSQDNGAQSNQRQTSFTDVTSLSGHSFHPSIDPPRLTQVPPVMNTVSVPRPIPLVQTNVNVPLSEAQQPEHSSTSDYQHAPSHDTEPQKPGSLLPPGDIADLVKLGDETDQQLKQLQEMAVEEALNNPAMQTLMQNQIAELNRQQEEARRRLLDLLDNQKSQQRRLQEQLMEGYNDNGVTDDSGSLGLNERSQQLVNFKPVSPPISPIPQNVEKENMDSRSNPSQGRGIVVNLPMADLDVSGGSFHSQKAAHTSH